MKTEWVFWCFRYAVGVRVCAEVRGELLSGTVVEQHIQNMYVRDRWIKFPMYLVKWDHLAADTVTDCRYVGEDEIKLTTTERELT